MLEKFIDKRFNNSSLIIIKQANEIIGEYRDDGMILTVRQLYYQFVARGYIANTMRSYKRIVNIINDARLTGLVSWDAIEDRTRNVQHISTWDSPASIMDTIVRAYTTDKWADQEYHVEVWIEKEALTGVISRICSKLEVPYFACRGYVSQSEIYRSAKRLEYMEKPCIVLHLGDHDPSGIDMTRDNYDRLDLLSNHADIRVQRIALNMDQIKQYDPPPNPTKLTDSRAGPYLAKFGTSSWELDALEPHVIRQLIEDHTNVYRDEEVWREREILQEEGRDDLKKCRTLLINGFDNED